MNFTKILILIILGLNTSCGVIQNLLGTSSTSSDGTTVQAGSSEIEIIASNKKFKFIPEQIIAKPGQILKIKIINQLSDLPLVFSVLKKDEDPIVNAFLGIQSGESNNWWPPEGHILAKSKTLAGNQSESLTITLPKEPGDYAFISSYPGQVDAFNGVIKILDPNAVVTTE